MEVGPTDRAWCKLTGFNINNLCQIIIAYYKKRKEKKNRVILSNFQV